MKNTSTFNTSMTSISQNLSDHDEFYNILQQMGPFEQITMPVKLVMSELLKTRDKTTLQALLQGKLRETFNYIDFEILLQNENNTGSELFMSLDTPQETAISGAERTCRSKDRNTKEPFNLPAVSSPATLYQFRQP